MNIDDLTYKIAFASVRGMGYDLAMKFLDIFSSEKEFFNISEKELKDITGGRSKIYTKSYRDSMLEKAEREIKFIEDNDINVVYYDSPLYPKRLAEATDAPILLFTVGKTNLNAAHIVSVVGTRHATEYGKHFCDVFIHELSEQVDDLVIVSGLAYGIDIASHRAAVRYDVPTIGVQARGLNKIYPSQHRNDAAKMVHNGGMILSDYMSQDEVHKGNFLARNRIIAALADCTVVVESADTGGALVTASIARSYNRDVFALPGRNSDQYSQGCNRLIRNSQAQLIGNAKDLVDSMMWKKKEQPHEQRVLDLFDELDIEAKSILDFLRNNGDNHINTIAQQLQIPVYKVMASLVELELQGLVFALPGSRYSIA